MTEREWWTAAADYFGTDEAVFGICWRASGLHIDLWDMVFNRMENNRGNNKHGAFWWPVGKEGNGERVAFCLKMAQQCLDEITCRIVERGDDDQA